MVESLSMRQIIQSHQRGRLAVDPLCWTACHLQLLQCSFTDPVEASPTARRDFAKRNGLCFILRTLESRKAAGRRSGINNLISHAECPLKSRQNLSFHFNSRIYKLECTAFYDRRQAQSPAIAAYIDREWISQMRREALYPRDDMNGNNVKGLEVYRKMLHSITPENPIAEPYVLAMLIGMAQEQQIAGLISPSQQDEQLSHNPVFNVRVLVSSKDKEKMHLYCADFTSAFLRKLDDLDLPAEPSVVSIRIIAIPYEPHESLRDRLFSILLPSQLEGKRHVTEGGGKSQQIGQGVEGHVPISCP
ncbi:hypothetical protein B0I35DRAFT_446442 [Stachybotrys elegans]|uniref:Uncharacterized protein n=1 Tax=Stachybotrys elegans TaxID=80388 RepID=A0A8K0WJL1_9HYPO|nr:hypothetical protein B0I35DRAFT_446442 [Stachybotrys elegans]